MLLPIAVVAALTASDSLPEASRRVEAVAVQPASVVVHRQPALPVVALRLAVLADDPPGYAGAGHLHQHLVYPRLRDRVGAVGGRALITRTSDAVVFTVLGPAIELEHLAAELRAALVTPEVGEPALLRASRELAEERLAEWETAGAHVRARLRGGLFPGDLPAAGTEAGATRLAAAGALRSAWSEMYRPERVSIIAVGDVRVEDVRRAFDRLPAAAPAPSGEPALRDTATLQLAAPQATHGWLGLAHYAGDLSPAAVSVAARLVRDELRERLPSASVEAEHWWSHHGQALAVVVAAPPADLASARRTLGTAVSATRGSLSDARVREAARGIRREMLFYSRTPERMAEVLGHFVDRQGEADAAERFYQDLDRTDRAEVARALDVLLERTPVRVEVPPQELRRR